MDLMHYVRFLRCVPRAIGPWKTIQLECIDKLTRVLDKLGIHLKWPVARIAIRGVRHSVSVRLGSSDYYALKQVFGWHYYGPAEKLGSASRIIDAGAHAGYFSILMLETYPYSQVVAVEPEPENFKICSANLAAYGSRAQVVQAGVWSHSAQLAVTGSGWAAEVREVSTRDSTTVEAVDVPFLLRMLGEEPADVLKLDIERSELEVFADAAQWLPLVRNIAIELHGADCETVYFEALDPFDYQLSHCGDVTFCMALRAKHSADATPGSVASRS